MEGSVQYIASTYSHEIPAYGVLLEEAISFIGSLVDRGAVWVANAKRAHGPRNTRRALVAHLGSPEYKPRYYTSEGTEYRLPYCRCIPRTGNGERGTGNGKWEAVLTGTFCCNWLWPVALYCYPAGVGADSHELTKPLDTRRDRFAHSGQRTTHPLPQYG